MHPADTMAPLPHANAITLMDSADYIARLLAAPRPGADRVLAFHDHRVGGICTDPRLLLAPLDDHLCHRGDGVFESIRYQQRRLFQLDLHLARLRRSAEAIRLAPPCTWDDLRCRVLAVARAGGQDEGGIRVLVGRGPGGFGISPAECPQSSLYIIAWRQTAPPEAWFAAGLSAFRSAMPAQRGPLTGVKHANYLPNVLMMDEARQRGMDVPLTFDAEGPAPGHGPGRRVHAHGPPRHHRGGHPVRAGIPDPGHRVRVRQPGALRGRAHWHGRARPRDRPPARGAAAQPAGRWNPLLGPCPLPRQSFVSREKMHRV